MWVLSLIYDGKISSKALRRGSTTQVGRSNEYKSSADSLHIGDLKVPKKYITIQIGSKDLLDLSRSPLSITFHSICTTSINDKIYKLPSKEAASITEHFEDDDLLLKVNANKSDRIQLRLRWVEVTIVPFSKRISYENEIQESPLPGLLRSLYEEGFDIRSTHDPILASHYLTIVDKNDYNLQIALSRAIPVVSYAWVDAMKDTPEKVEDWLIDIQEEYLFSGSKDNFVFPDTRRRHLLSGVNAYLCYGSESKHTKRLQQWLECLGSKPQMVNVTNESAVDDALRDVDDPYVFVVKDDKPVDLLRERSNSVDSLWEALINVDTKSLKVFQPAIKRESQVTDLRPTQRKKRRKLEKVGDTDFFSFSQASSTPAPEGVLNNKVEPSPNAFEPSGASPKVTNSGGRESNVLEHEVQVPSTIVVDADDDADSSKTASLDSGEQQKNSAGEDSATTRPIEDAEESHKRRLELESSTDNKRPKIDVPTKPRRILASVSLADAVLSAKRNADEMTKKELGLDLTDGVNEKLDNLVIVEEVDLTVRKIKSNKQEAHVEYKGRKNFKNFRKAKAVNDKVSRNFIPLEDHDNDIRFEDSEPMAPQGRNKGKDFDSEMKGVKGYQPEESQLFVEEESDVDEDGGSFSFSTNSKPKTTTTRIRHGMDFDSEDDDVAFSFSRK